MVSAKTLNRVKFFPFFSSLLAQHTKRSFSFHHYSVSSLTPLLCHKEAAMEMEFDLENPLTSFNDQLQHSETIQDLFTAESDHMPSHGFLLLLKTSDFHASFRRQAISLILQASNLDPLLSYLAVNYLDRFISRHEIQEEKPWVLRLIAISCLSLAAKMRSTPLSPASLNKQRNEELVLDAQSIHRMEVVILDALSWRMRSITPFSFVHFFVSLFELQDPPLIQALRDGASDIIFKSHHEIKFLEFKPSTIAASALLSASYELFPMQFASFNSSIVACGYINQEGLVQCFNAMQEMMMMETGSSTISNLECKITSTSGGHRGSKRRKVNHRVVK